MHRIVQLDNILSRIKRVHLEKINDNRLSYSDMQFQYNVDPDSLIGFVSWNCYVKPAICRGRTVMIKLISPWNHILKFVNRWGIVMYCIEG